MSELSDGMICLISARTLRAVARGFFDEVDLSGREQTWVDRDSFDAGLIAAARYLLAQADNLEAVALGEQP